MSERNELNEDQLENVSGGASFSADMPADGDDGSRDFDMNKDDIADPNFGGEPDVRDGENPHDSDPTRGAR